MKVWSGTETTVPKKQEKRGKVLFRPLSKNSVNMVVFLGGIGVLVKVPHVDREFSFGNRHSKTSTPKHVFDIFWKSSRPIIGQVITAQSQEMAAKVSLSPKLWGVKKKRHGHNFQNFGSKSNQRGTMWVSSTLIRFGAEILKIVVVSFFLNTS